MDLTQYLDPQTIASLKGGGYVLMLALMTIEGPIVTFIAAFLASLGVFDIYLVFILGWIGDILGDFLFYSIGRYGWHLFKKRTTIKNKKESLFIQKIDHLIHMNLALAILLIKFTPYAPPIGLTYIGKLRVDIRKYLLYSLILCIPIPFVSGMIGYHIGIINMIVSEYRGATLFFYILGVIGVIAISLVSFWYIRRKSAEILKQQKNISDKIEKNTKSDTSRDEVAGH